MKYPDFSYEQKLWQKGFGYVIGIDEAGRGAWAGPIVVAAVVWPQTLKLKNKNEKVKMIEEVGINDSKELRPRQRENLAQFIKTHALAWDVTEVGVGVINKIGIGKATEKAMRKTVKDIIKKLKKEANFFVLVDYFYIPYLYGLGRKNQLGIKDGDQKSISIAAASILAKVYRDKIMRSLGRRSRFKVYGWGENKGYGTKKHQKAIEMYGLTRYHRKDFVRSFK
jgi:ribonuclease HII